MANETLYSDAYYGPKAAGFAPSLDLAYNVDADTAKEEDGAETKSAKHYHLDLPTLLDDAHLAVDITRWFGFITIKVNGHVDVAVQDGLARDGVLQVVDHILIPPHNHKGAWNGGVDGKISVKELVERLEPFVKKDVGGGETGEEGVGEL